MSVGGPPLGEMSISVPMQQAAGGTITVGDLVDVIASTGPSGAYYVAQGLRVLGVAPITSASGVLEGSTGSYFVVVAVSKQTALRIATALAAQGGSGAADIEIVRSTGEAQVSPIEYGTASASGAQQHKAAPTVATVPSKTG